jgi:hypothetical protein
MVLARYASVAALILITSMAHAQWEHLNVGAPPVAVSGSQSITTFNGAIYVATYPTGVRKSTDDGATWTIVNNGLPVTNGSVNARSVGHSATALLCGTQSGVYRSLNDGASWEPANGPVGASLPVNDDLYANKIYTFGNTTFVVYTGMVQNSLNMGGGIFRTINDGTSWLAGYSGLSANMTVYNLALDGTTLYASTSTSLMQSTDFGQSWNQAGTANFAVFAVQSVNDRIVAITSLGARWSTNGGATWTPSVNYPVAAPVAGADLIAFDGKFYATTKSGTLGIYRTLNGGINWEPYNDGIVDQADLFSQEEFHANGNMLYIACLFDSYSLEGSFIGTDELNAADLPVPYPTAFGTHFTVDLSAQQAGATVLLLDASGREVLRHGNVPASPLRIERGSLGAGVYQCVFLDPSSGAMRSLGRVIAE